LQQRPQLYWKLDNKKGQAFDMLLRYWAGVSDDGAGNPGGAAAVPVLAGLYTSKYAGYEIVKEVQQTRSVGGAMRGHIHFSARALVNSKETRDAIVKSGIYAAKARPFAAADVHNSAVVIGDGDENVNN
jgi:hypothetical protein